MNREILFRAKRVDNGEWVEGFYVCFNEIAHFIYSKYAETDCGGFYPDMFEVDENTICQYTGLTDRYEHKIWENDVVEIPTENGYFKLVWNSTEARWEMENEEEELIVTFDNYWGYQVEVVGNILDNPGLVGGAG